MAGPSDRPDEQAIVPQKPGRYVCAHPTRRSTKQRYSQIRESVSPEFSITANELLATLSFTHIAACGSLPCCTDQIGQRQIEKCLLRQEADGWQPTIGLDNNPK